MMRKGELAKNEALQAGDVVFVPNRKTRRSITEYLGFLYPLGGLVNLLR
jgi:hypothetical protein